MKTMKTYAKEHNIDINHMFDLVLGEGGGILPTKTSFTGYFAEITPDALICVNEKMGIRTKIPFTDFESAEFGIGSGNLWLQCQVNGAPFVFCTTRGNWKKPSARLLMEKINAVTPIEDMKAYRRVTGAFGIFFLLFG